MLYSGGSTASLDPRTHFSVTLFARFLGLSVHIRPLRPRVKVFGLVGVQANPIAADRKNDLLAVESAAYDTVPLVKKGYA